MSLNKKFLGIDYGTKRVGIALSDDGGSMAFPRTVLPNNKHLLREIEALCAAEGVAEIVIGESLNYAQKPNPLMEHITPFKKELEDTTNLPVHFEREFMTSAEAKHVQGDVGSLDASAAALILQSYLDKQHHG
ncbi:MAG: Holliday junction resolvase RuvX [Candidatus Yonathbacteria bacterium]|nr:Holliday junction resolvase RuvX [Candidatus Yonathbacteria bacterium]